MPLLTSIRITCIASVAAAAVLSAVKTSAQSTVHYGAHAAYNLGTGGLGFGLRSNLPVTDRLELVPQAEYYHGQGLTFPAKWPGAQTTETPIPVRELNAGLLANYAFFNYPQGYGKFKADHIRLRIYGQGGLKARYWMNNDGASNALQKSKWSAMPEVGLGIAYGNAAYRLFLEGTGNFWGNQGIFKSMESFTKVGFLISPEGLRRQRLLRCSIPDTDTGQRRGFFRRRR